MGSVEQLKKPWYFLKKKNNETHGEKNPLPTATENSFKAKTYTQSLSISYATIAVPTFQVKTFVRFMRSYCVLFRHSCSIKYPSSLFLTRISELCLTWQCLRPVISTLKRFTETLNSNCDFIRTVLVIKMQH